jgi:hypothetical protein
MGEPGIGIEHTVGTFIQGKVCVLEVNAQQFLNAGTLYIVIVPCQNVMPVVLYQKFNVHTCTVLFAQSAAFFTIRQCDVDCCSFPG